MESREESHTFFSNFIGGSFRIYAIKHGQDDSQEMFAFPCYLFAVEPLIAVARPNVTATLTISG
jgi:hypothetical protein